ncbi:hypothetical protein BAUCODRAFT_106474 [Baudoinia panamericana UAMH 10762]|uniref:Nephrocystin 3-like N-terminal domain-containing protein n=1 Tax=Baudoinia panamericana (strain UAMH 10762) TaxID=717646 RepID=M2MKC0_BAUPA|nr:uncharacterized protein BAUCODRAFT_106474 [Baudoinia panamericana UAMH 10762]EMC97141.1 hypothetical protein BAUCODRAFT_106474 [Baudoinia panamericana UAMH 10762]
MAGLDVAAGAVGIASFGIQVCQGLLSYYNGWKDYKSDISSAYDAIADLSKTLGLLKGSLERERLDDERSERVKTCLRSCEDGLRKLSAKLQELRKHGTPRGVRQKILSEAQRMLYPFRAETLLKLRQDVEGIQERLKLAIQVLQLDTNIAILAVQQSEQFRRMIDWLSPPDPWTNHHSARQRHEPNTGEWLLQCDQYRGWKAGAVRHVWMHGKAGCGKTVLCSTAVEDIQSHCQAAANAGCAVFYFSFSDDRKQSYENLLRSLIAQLGWKEPGLSMLRQAYDKQNRSVPGVDELERILSSSVSAFDDVFVLLDALDECPESGDLRQDMLVKVEKITQESTRIKIFATSRESGDIRDSMDTIRAKRIDIATSAVDADIRQYVTSQLASDRRLAGLGSASKAAIETTIMERSDGMFKWASCQLQELKKLKGSRPSHIAKALHDLPATLDETYTRMLTGIEDRYRSDALTCLRWLAYARSPPTLSQLVDAVITDCERVQVDFDDRGSLEDPLNILSGLIMIIRGGNDDEDGEHAQSDDVVGEDDDGGLGYDARRLKPDTRVRLAHFSVKEFLESERILESHAKSFHLQPSLGHHFIAQCCLTYMAQYSKCNNKKSTKEDLDVFPLVQYAAESWYYHSSLQRSEECSLECYILTTDEVLQDWLSIHQPDRSWEPPFSADAGNDTNKGLYYASFVGLQVAAALLLDKGADVNAQGGRYGNALQAVSFKGQAEIVRILLDKGAEIDAQGGWYGNALHAVSTEGYAEIVRILLDKGADINAQGGRYGNALQAASFKGQAEIVRILLDKGAEINAQGGWYGNALHAASTGGYAEIVRMLLDKGADINAQGGQYGNALQAASFEGYKEIVQMLLDKGADVNAQGGEFGNALQAALFQGNVEIVRILLDKGADINVQGGEYGNVLQAASFEYNAEIIRILLDKGADINI